MKQILNSMNTSMFVLILFLVAQVSMMECLARFALPTLHYPLCCNRLLGEINIGID